MDVFINTPLLSCYCSHVDFPTVRQMKDPISSIKPLYCAACLNQTRSVMFIFFFFSRILSCFFTVHTLSSQSGKPQLPLCAAWWQWRIVLIYKSASSFWKMLFISRLRRLRLLRSSVQTCNSVEPRSTIRRRRSPFAQILHKVFNSDHFGAACYGNAIIRFLCLRGLQGVDHCYFMSHAVLWISSFQTQSSTRRRAGPSRYL